MKILHRFTNACLWESDHETIRATVEAAVEFGANLAGASLVGANLAGARLDGARLDGARLVGANLDEANLVGANLDGANLAGASLVGASLDGANLVGANLAGANLAGANLAGARLAGAIAASLVVARTRILPAGSIEGWKKCDDGILVRLSIPADCPRSNAWGRKCRAAYADVIEIVGANEARTVRYDLVTVYRVGERVTPDSWDEDWRNECSHGIHFFITREEAENYER